MGRRLLHVLAGLRRRLRRGHDERRIAKARARFWAEVREGEREAKAQARP